MDVQAHVSLAALPPGQPAAAGSPAAEPGSPAAEGGGDGAALQPGEQRESKVIHTTSPTGLLLMISVQILLCCVEGGFSGQQQPGSSAGRAGGAAALRSREGR